MSLLTNHVMVLKFGGTSLGTPARVRRAALRVRAHVRQGRGVVVVASAIGHTTDRLIRALDQVGAATDGAGRERDRALATGEALAAALLAARIATLGVPAVSLSGGEAGLEAAGEFGAGTLTRIDPAPLARWLETGAVPVVAGFQARTRDGETITLGRGSSDTTAVALAAALGGRRIGAPRSGASPVVAAAGALPCHLVTDVAAVFNRDPSRDVTARPYHELSHHELVRLAEDGARVVHPTAARLALEHRVPLYIYSFRAPLGEIHGTRVGEAL